MRIQRCLVAIVVAVIMIWMPQAHAAVDATTAAGGPREVVERVHAVLLSTMRDAEALGPRGRYARLEPVMSEAYDFDRMIAVASGAAWTQASEADRARLAQAFQRFSVATYAARFLGWSGESFVIVGERDGPAGARIVDTELLRPGQDTVAISYVLQQRDDRWRIVDVLLDRAISELALRRSEYRQILQSNGARGLADALDAQADAMLAGGKAP